MVFQPIVTLPKQSSYCANNNNKKNLKGREAVVAYSVMISQHLLFGLLNAALGNTGIIP
jgi:hypothetical protein